MRAIIPICMLLLVAFARPVSASSILITAVNVLSSTTGFSPICGDGGENVTSATASCGFSLASADGVVTTFEGSGAAAASFGSLGAEASASVTNARSDSPLSGGAVGSGASMFDALPNLPSDGAISFEFVLDGCAVNNNAGLARGEVHFVNRNTSTNNSLSVDYYSDTKQVNGPAQVTRSSDCSATIATNRLPVSFFPLGFALNLSTEVSVGAIDQDLVTASGEADFLDTLVIKSISVFDANGVPITDPNVGLAESGVRYVVNGSEVAPVSEPGSVLLLGVGLLGLARRTRRSRHSSR